MKLRREEAAFKCQQNTEKDTEILFWMTNIPVHMHIASLGHLLDILQGEIISSKAATQYFIISMQDVFSRLSPNAPEGSFLRKKMKI